MRISLRVLNHQQGPIEEEASVKLEGVEREHPELLKVDPLDVRVTAWKESGLYHVQGEQSTRVDFRCSRCLTPFEQSVSMKWDRLFADETSRAQHDEQEEEEVEWIDPDRPTDLTPYIREAFLLKLPIAPVCREECQGLCPECGVNLNEETCRCQTRRIDPRLAKLEELLKEDD